METEGDEKSPPPLKIAREEGEKKNPHPTRKNVRKICRVRRSGWHPEQAWKYTYWVCETPVIKIVIIELFPNSSTFPRSKRNSNFFLPEHRCESFRPRLSVGMSKAVKKLRRVRNKNL